MGLAHTFLCSVDTALMLAVARHKITCWVCSHTRFCVTQSAFAVYPLRCSLGLLGFALRDSAAAPKARGGAHEGRRARG
jgi:hypothetical protein